jgi:hypothetical protein
LYGHVRHFRGLLGAEGRGEADVVVPEEEGEDFVADFLVHTQ